MVAIDGVPRTRDVSCVERGPLALELETERLILRPPEADDFESFRRLQQDPAVRRYLGGPLSDAAAWRQFGHARTCWMLGQPSLFTVVLKRARVWAGVVGPWGLFANPDLEVLWQLHPEFWGMGLAQEAASTLLDWLFMSAGWREARFYIHPQNAPSLAIADRLGARPLADAPQRGVNHRSADLLYGCSRDDWLGARPVEAPIASRFSA